VRAGGCVHVPACVSVGTRAHPESAFFTPICLVILFPRYRIESAAPVVLDVDPLVLSQEFGQYYFDSVVNGQGYDEVRLSLFQSGMSYAHLVSAPSEHLPSYTPSDSKERHSAGTGKCFLKHLGVWPSFSLMLPGGGGLMYFVLHAQCLLILRFGMHGAGSF
jgi:hypothetical protein